MIPASFDLRKRAPAPRGLALRSSLACMAVFALVGLSCTLDPVHATAVEQLGEERSDLYPPESEYHRPGEPCVLCHSNKGPASSEFALGGTVFWGPDDYDRRVDQAYVRILDANNRPRCFVTNCNGNFYVRKSDISSLTFPLLVSVERTKNPGVDESTMKIRRMTAHIGREPSCATCHVQYARDYASPGQIRLYDSEDAVMQANVPLASCPKEGDRVTLCPEDRP